MSVEGTVWRCRGYRGGRSGWRAVAGADGSLLSLIHPCCYANWFCGHRDYSQMHFTFHISHFHEYFIFIRFLSFCQLMRLKMFLIISAALAEWVVIRMAVCICISDSEYLWVALCVFVRDVAHSPCGQSHLLRLICDSHHKQSKQSVSISSFFPFLLSLHFPLCSSICFSLFSPKTTLPAYPQVACGVCQVASAKSNKTLSIHQHTQRHTRPHTHTKPQQICCKSK